METDMANSSTEEKQPNNCEIRNNYAIDSVSFS